MKDPFGFTSIQRLAKLRCTETERNKKENHQVINISQAVGVARSFLGPPLQTTQAAFLAETNRH